MSRAGLAKLAAWLLAGLSFSASAVLPTVPTPSPEAAPSFGAAGLLQAGFGLAMVLGLIFLCAWLARRFGLQQPGSGRLLKVVSSVMVGQRERVVVVEIGDAWLVLGVAAGQVRTLHTLPAQKNAETQPAPAPAGFAGGTAFSRKLMDALNPLNQARKRD